MTDYLFRNRDTAVRDAIHGLARLYAADLEVSDQPLYLLARRPKPARRVGLVSGGG